MHTAPRAETDSTLVAAMDVTVQNVVAVVALV